MKAAADGVLDPTLERLAERIRGLFIQAYRNHYRMLHGTPSRFGDRPVPYWDGGYDGHREHQAAWPRMARLCHDHQCEPAGFVQSLFDGRTYLPRPNDCIGPAALRGYLARAATADRQVVQALVASRNTLATVANCRRAVRRLADRDAIASVLEDPTVPLSGLFRYKIAAEFGYPAIADRYRDAALAQYLPQRDVYDRTWAPIPEDLRSAAARVIAEGYAS